MEGRLVMRVGRTAKNCPARSRSSRAQRGASPQVRCLNQRSAAGTVNVNAGSDAGFDAPPVNVPAVHDDVIGGVGFPG